MITSYQHYAHKKIIMCSTNRIWKHLYLKFSSDTKCFLKMSIPETNGCNSYVTEKDVELIVSKDRRTNGKLIEEYNIRNASDKMLGFLCDYWKLKVQLAPSKRVLHYFIKAISVTNEAKEKIVKELDLFEKECYFYEVIKTIIDVEGLKPWCPGFITRLNNALVFEDMNIQQYKLRDKFLRFDMAHALEALKTLARFHASSLIFEEKKSTELRRNYFLNEDIMKSMDHGGYVKSDNWYNLCMEGALAAVKKYSKYNEKEIKIIESQIRGVWESALDLAEPIDGCRSVICHRDLWNNNLMFHYSTDGSPDDCLLIDFQALKYMPPAGDVMLLLCCNVDPTFRENNLNIFLNYYLQELHNILSENGVNPNIVDRKDFYESANEQRKWGLVICACLMPQFWINDDETTRIFTDTEQFNEILNKDKAAFILKMMETNNDYRMKVIEIFEEICDRYCL